MCNDRFYYVVNIHLASMSIYTNDNINQMEANQIWRKLYSPGRYSYNRIYHSCGIIPRRIPTIDVGLTAVLVGNGYI